VEGKRKKGMRQKVTSGLGVVLFLGGLGAVFYLVMNGFVQVVKLLPSNTPDLLCIGVLVFLAGSSLVEYLRARLRHEKKELDQSGVLAIVLLAMIGICSLFYHLAGLGKDWLQQHLPSVTFKILCWYGPLALVAVLWLAAFLFHPEPPQGSDDDYY